MKSKIIARLFSLIMIMSVMSPFLGVISASAEANKIYLVDEPEKLSEEQFDELSRKLDSISETYGYDIAVVICNGTNGLSTKGYAMNKYADMGFTKDGMMLVIDDLGGEYFIRPEGKFRDYMSEDALDYIESSILPALKDEDFNEASHAFANTVEELYALEKDGKQFRKPFKWGSSILIALGIGILVALIVTAVFKSQLKSVQKQLRAESYVRNGSMNVTESNDLFLYHNLIRVPRPKNSSGGGSRTGGGGGRSSGGRGGSFR